MHSLFVMPSHYNCCVPLCTNHSRRNSKLSFYRIPKDKSLRKEYTRLIRNETLKLEGEDKTWTPGPWTPSLDRVHGPPSWTGSMDPHFFIYFFFLFHFLFLIFNISNDNN